MMETIKVKAYREYYKRVWEAFTELNEAIKNSPKHTYVRIDFLMEHGRVKKTDVEIAIKYPLIGNSKDFIETKKEK